MKDISINLYDYDLDLADDGDYTSATLYYKDWIKTLADVDNQPKNILYVYDELTSDNDMMI